MKLTVETLCLSSAGVTGVLPTEIFNQTARPAAYMIAGSMMWLNLFIVGMIFPFLVVSLCPHNHTHPYTEFFKFKTKSKCRHHYITRLEHIYNTLLYV